MRAREFIVEQQSLPPETKDPMRDTYSITGLSAADPYKSYRFGVAIARARSDYRKDEVNPFMPEWSAETAFGEHAIVAGFNNNVEKVIDAALKMTGVSGGKTAVSTPPSAEPDFVETTSPVQGFKGYPR